VSTPTTTLGVLERFDSCLTNQLADTYNIPKYQSMQNHNAHTSVGSSHM
jgi:hypothetical protein